MAAHARSEEDEIIRLSADQSRLAFEDEVVHRLGIDAETFVSEWRTGKLDRQNPDVIFLLSLLPIYGLPAKRA